VWLGRWPFRQLPSEGTAALAAKLPRNGVKQAWASSFDGVFGPVAPSNAVMAQECRRARNQFFVPFGTVNLKANDWREELRRCSEEYRMPGLRLVPNYHGYQLDEPEFAELLDLASERRLLIQLVLEIEDERVQRAPTRSPVDAQPLPGLLKNRKAVRMMLLNWHRALKPALRKELVAAGVWFDIASVEGVGGVAALMDQIPERQIVFGSNAPFFYFEAARLKLQEAALAPQQLKCICSENALSLV
jgi:predicted TIM-barrel fold metal-dependent hydrolase